MDLVYVISADPLSDTAANLSEMVKNYCSESTELVWQPAKIFHLEKSFTSVML